LSRNGEQRLCSPNTGGDTAAASSLLIDAHTTAKTRGKRRFGSFSRALTRSRSANASIPRISALLIDARAAEVIDAKQRDSNSAGESMICWVHVSDWMLISDVNRRTISCVDSMNLPCWPSIVAPCMSTPASLLREQKSIHRSRILSHASRSPMNGP
jgi:hypothetical protein